MCKGRTNYKREKMIAKTKREHEVKEETEINRENGVDLLK